MPPPTHARALLIAMLVVAIALMFTLIWPFWVAFFLAAVLSATLRSPMEWLTRKLRGRRQIAATLLTLAVLLAVVLPVAGIGTFLVRQVLDGIEWLRNLIASEGFGGLLTRLPEPVENAARRFFTTVPQQQQQIQRIAEQGQQAAGVVTSVISATGTVVFQTVMMLIALFFMLVDGARLVAWLDRHVPLRPGLLRELIEEFRKTSVSVLTATLATAGIQTVTALVGYLIARAPNVIFFTLATFVIALVPALGATVMVVTVAILLLATGHLLAGVFLAAWGIGFVSIVDNAVRPYLLKGGMELHGGVVFFALLGGLAVFGGIGLVLGPLIVTFLLAVLKMYEREYGRGVTSEPPAEVRPG
ncbi:AI-2E family transporter [Anaeromyxobacter terrae]|uniref:AI-2E family transporter n=1 Tax=Anaeromyxobacter terrae TaxID=2925406 RepID=UPI001F571A50|nr:AI-2E family transporter [Anaeromyxobacter sp. SG22]